MVRLPVIYLAVGVFMAPYFAILSVVLMFLTGCRVHIEKYNNPRATARYAPMPAAQSAPCETR